MSKKASLLGRAACSSWMASLVSRSATELAGKRPPGGGDRIRTDDRLVANQVLYQLSYAPG